MPTRNARVLVFVFFAVTTGVVNAARYKFENVADTTGPIDAFFSEGCIGNFGNGPQINNQGTVAFFATLDLNSGSGSLFTAANGMIDDVLDLESADVYYDCGGHSINDSDNVVFRGTRRLGGPGIFIGPDSTTDTVIDFESGLADFGLPAINNDRSVAYIARDAIKGRTIFTGSDPVSDFIDPSPFEFLRSFSMNNNGTVAFTTCLVGNETCGIFTGPDSLTDTLLDTSGPFEWFGNTYISINDEGVVAFAAIADSSPDTFGIFVGPDPVADVVVDTSGGFESLRNFVINDAGKVAFSASIDDQGEYDSGVYTGPSPVEDRVIATGDELFGQTIESAALGDMNDLGQIVFSYSLENGVYGIAIATPVTPADANMDGLVNHADFNIWFDHSFTENSNFSDGDFNEDGVIDVSDFNVWHVNRTSAVEANAVPEPATGVLLLSGILAACWQLRQRRSSIHRPIIAEHVAVGLSPIRTFIRPCRKSDSLAINRANKLHSPQDFVDCGSIGLAPRVRQSQVKRTREVHVLRAFSCCRSK